MSRLTTLELLLTELGEPDRSEDLATRHEDIQNEIYLSQSKVDAGYHFGWYGAGPYSPALAEDLQELRYKLDLGVRAAETSQLNGDVKEAMSRMREFVRDVPDPTMDQSDWLELVSRVRFLYSTGKHEETLIRALVGESRPDLASHVPLAITHLAGQDLI